MTNGKKAVLIILVILLGFGAGVGSFVFSILNADENIVMLGSLGGQQFLLLSFGWCMLWFSITMMGKKVVEITDGGINIKHEVYTWSAKIDKKELNRVNYGDERVILKRADDEILEFIVKGNWKYAIIGFMAWAGILAWIIRFFISEDTVPFQLAFFTPPFFAGVIFMLMNAFSEIKYSFDRFAGKIRVRVYSLSFSIPFDKVVPFNHWDRMYLKHKYFRFPFRVYGERGAMQWSFYVQYMDKNMTLPPGTAFDPYREKDFLRRKAERFPKSIYPIDKGTWMCDATVGYIYGTKEFKEKLAKCKKNIGDMITEVICYVFFDLGDKELIHNDIILIGFYQDYFVFKYGAPKNQPYVIIEEEPTDCFWVHCRSGNMTIKGNAYPKEIKPVKK